MRVVRLVYSRTIGRSTFWRSGIGSDEKGKKGRSAEMKELGLPLVTARDEEAKYHGVGSGDPVDLLFPIQVLALCSGLVGEEVFSEWR